MKRFILMPLILACIGLFAQIPAPKSVNKYLNDMVWTQVFNNFEIKTPLVLPFTPGGMFAFDGNYIDNDVFFQEMLKSDDLFVEKDIMIKEFTRMINAPFFSYIPADSTLVMKSLYKNRILYTLSMNNSNTASTVDFMLPDNKTKQTVKFDDEGDLLLLEKKEKKKDVVITNQKTGKSQAVQATRLGKNKTFLGEESRYEGGQLKTKEVYYENSKNKKRKFVTKYDYRYDPLNQIASIRKLKKNGKPADSLVYNYTNDTLLSIGHSVYKDESDFIFYQYHEGKLSGKTLKKGDFYVEISYAYDKGKISTITYVDKLREQTSKYGFEYNVAGSLVSMTFTPVHPIYGEEMERQVLFTYNERNNLKAVKMVDRKGVIDQEIVYESDFR